MLGASSGPPWPACTEPAVAELLGRPDGFALGALVAVGWPVPERQYTRLTRRPVAEIVFAARFGVPFRP